MRAFKFVAGMGLLGCTDGTIGLPPSTTVIPCPRESVTALALLGTVTYTSPAGSISADVAPPSDAGTETTSGITVGYDLVEQLYGQITINLTFESGADGAYVRVPFQPGPATYSIVGDGYFGADTPPQYPIAGSLVVQTYSEANCQDSPNYQMMQGPTYCDRLVDATLSASGTNGAGTSISGTFTLHYATTVTSGTCLN